MPRLGHLFLVRSDLTDFTCDALLIPCDSTLHVMPHWHKLLRHGLPPFSTLEARVHPYSPFSPHTAAVFLVNTGAPFGTGDEWYVAGVHAFLDAAYDAFVHGGHKPRCSRSLPLFALPLVGTGAGGKCIDQGGLLSKIIQALLNWTEQHAVDVVLVLFGVAAFDAAQMCRRQLLLGKDSARTIDDISRARALLKALDVPEHALEDQFVDRLLSKSRAARCGDLCLLIGAGVSMPAGLPSCAELLVRLAERVGMDAMAIRAMQELPMVDQGEIIAKRFAAKGMQSMTDAIIAELRIDETKPALGHALLASLDARCAVTTNYDQLFERAAEGGQDPVLILPHEAARLPNSSNARWLLKMHGCATRPAEIVLTRGDYTAFSRSRSVLLGIVAAVLVTKQMLLVGFSLTDDNFYRLMGELTGVLGGAKERQGRALATALMVDVSPAREELWSGDVNIIQPPGETMGERARMHDILLDAINAMASTVGKRHFFDHAFRDVLNEDDRRLRDRLAEIVREFRNCNSSAYDAFKRFCDGLGWNDRIELGDGFEPNGWLMSLDLGRLSRMGNSGQWQRKEGPFG